MYKIVAREELADGIFSMDVLAPRVAETAKPGQFVIVIADEKGERIPLTICDYDIEKGTVNLVIQTVGLSTKKLSELKVGDGLASFVGPLGQPSKFVNEDINKLKDKKILFVAGGVGAAPVYPQAKWLHEKGIDVDVIIGAKTKDLVILEEKMEKVAGKLYMATDDGSYGFKGMVTDLIEELVKNQGKKYDLIICIGPMIMMKFVCKLTKELGIETVASLNPVMVDGTGMCGGCRVTVGNETKFACVDGPEFDGHLVDFDEALRRLTQYKTEEANKLENYVCKCHQGGVDSE